MRYHIIRHAQTELNAQGKSSCEEHEPLNETGKRQALLLSEYLQSLQIDEILVSPFPRALDTIKPYYEKTGQKVSVNPFLAEGMYNLDPNAGIQNPEFDENGLPINGETVTQFRGRVMAFIEGIKNDKDSGTKIVITHGHFIREFLNMLLDARNYVRWPVNNCSETLIDVQDDLFVRHVNKDVINDSAPG